MLLGADDAPVALLEAGAAGAVAAGAVAAGGDVVPAAVSVFGVAGGFEEDSPAGGFILSE